MLLRAALIAAALAAIVLPARAQPPAADGWISFEGTLSGVAQPQMLAMEEGRSAVIVRISGPVVLTSGKGLPRGFLSEFIGFGDGRGNSMGAAVWTDDRGDRIFSDLKGSLTQAGRRLSGVVTGGTGRYAGLTGEWTLDWEYSIQGEEGTFQVRAVKFTGRVRLGPPRAAETPK